MYAIIKKKLLDSTVFNFLDCDVSLEDVDKIFLEVNYRRCLLLKGTENIIIGNRSHLVDNFSGSTGLCVYK